MSQAENSANRSPLAGARILLVDDSRVNQLVAQQILLAAGAKVAVVDDGKKAVEATRQQSFDLVLMDIYMPEMDGYEATRQIRTRFSARKLPVIAMTGGSSETDERQAAEVGMNGYLFKPIELEALFTALRRWKMVMKDA
ncbi:MAG: response regulator [Gammaproteobacteria bacterium]|nr:response regulator [Gammaproteobacteria bacterium]MBT4605374.1 response regulator [Thiotrichales bacterium]MBT3472866.1 response regulator [Gammaproteobacteria bacterium]MBT3967529.1 response regulator [Gammaproteobacteria bacterium]MBT4080906.1 response regulator [Gammaproteobacteria bacterium]